MAGPEPKLRALFSQAAAFQTAEEQAAFLDQACRGDAPLRAQLEELLRAQREAGSFLQEPSASPAATVDEVHTSERPGTTIGPYKLIEPIGEGGMGTVWMAQQTEPVKRLVALKLIKAGMDSKQVIARFEAERQALALMDHPHIAKVLDAGTTSTGRPYFVMDLVKGVPITRYCDEHHLTPRQRLELFVPVCQAIQHAHQKGIIHRDLKPSNVLVALYDGKPVPKVIDFGVAKAAGQSLTDKTLVTGFGNIVGTLEYMSPEQAEINQLDIDTRSDIYSLGVLLYELLAGSPPFTRKELEKAGMLEMLRVIREEEPSKPSMKLSSSDALPTLSANRGTEPAKLTKLVRGELDWIVMKALEKDRNRRYETANCFAMDVQRYLADEPVQACPPSAWYRFRKLARRKRAVLLTAGLVAAALVVGLAVATWQAVRASRAEEEKGKELVAKVKENQRANKNLRLALDGLGKIYGDLAEDDLANQPHLEGLRTEYLRRLRDFFGEFARANRDDPRAQLEAGKAYFRLAAIQRILGQQAEAEKNVQQAIAALQSLSDTGSADGGLHLAMSWHEYGNLLLGGPRAAEAEQYLRKALTMLTTLPSSEDREFLWALGHVRFHLACTLENMHRLPEAEDTQKKARAVFQQLATRFPDDSSVRQRAASALHQLARIKLEGKDFKQGEVYLRRARAEMGQVLKGNAHVAHFQYVQSSIEHDLARLLQLTRRAGEAKDGFRRAFGLRLKLAANHPTIPAYRRAVIDSLKLLDECLQLGGSPTEGLAAFENLVRDHPTVPEYQLALAKALSNRGGVLFLQKQWQRGEDLLRRALSLEEKVALESPEVLEARCGTLQSLVFVVHTTGRRDEAEKLMRAQLALRKKWFAQIKDDPRQQPNPAVAAFYARHSTKEARYDVGRPAEKLAHSYGMLIVLLRNRQNWQEIADLYEEALKVAAEEASLNNDAAWFLATCPVVKLRDPARAVRLAEKTLVLAKKDPLQARSEGGYRNTLGVANYRAGNWQAAITALEQSRKLRQGGDAVDWLFLAMAHQKLGHTDTARKWCAQAVQWLEKNRAALAADPAQAEELGRFRGEAEEILGQTKK
jgi:serine/threonine protein kinase/tetratricopeptide (TPR) repeat protein